ncbi:hypothetical protein E3P99_02087 [Wallemia hederae]|uniref:Transcription elongation factor SPT5 n=1 Tax=Wallemia hederae TaxID=1540922 RepID=A0A4T0FNQ3_9BASI|nr:hypothetical protein E3P99_02087 [Wallemia hederae]
MEYEDPKPNLKAEDIDEKLDHSSGDEKVHDDDEENPVEERIVEEDDDVRDEEEEQDAEDDEEAEDDDDDDDRPTKKKRKQNNPRNRFLDVEAEVDDDDEEADDDDEVAGKDLEFIQETDEPEEGGRAIRGGHTRIDRRERELYDQDAEQIAENIRERFGKSRYQGEMNEVPQRLLMPSVEDPSLWGVRCRPGREKDIVISLMSKFVANEWGSKPLEIYSVFSRDSIQGLIYIEARSPAHVLEAVKGLVGVYSSASADRKPMLIPVDEMADLLKIRKQVKEVKPGSWVRIKRGKYQGDLAQVMDITENGEVAGVKFIPRIDLNPKEENTYVGADGKKRKKGANSTVSFRPQQRLYNHADILKAYGQRSSTKKSDKYVFQGDTFKDGLLEKDIAISGLQTEDVNPQIDEITKFASQSGEGSGGEIDLNMMADAVKQTVAILQPGDVVEIFEGQLAGIVGSITALRGDVVTIKANVEEYFNQQVEVLARSVRKKFATGDHIKVINGKYTDETGLVISINDRENTVTFISDMSQLELSVFSRDIRVAAEIGAAHNTVGAYELHDLVQLDQQTAGVIFKTEHNQFKVLDQNGIVRTVGPRQISMRRDSRRAVATDSENHDIRIGDMVKEVEGEQRKGQVLHIHRSVFIFLYNREISENSGVFITRSTLLASVAPKTLNNSSVDLSQMNPAMNSVNPVKEKGGMVGSQMLGKGMRDKLADIPVQIIRGSYKGMIGVVKGTNGNQIRIELTTNSKIISLEKEMCMRRHNNQLVSLDTYVGPPRNQNQGDRGSREASQMSGGSTPRNMGGATPWQGGGKTPFGAGGATPWGAGGRTPGGPAGGRTPAAGAWAAGSKTPGWGAGARTPAAGAWAAGGKTPGARGGATPGWGAGSKTPGWGAGSKTPMGAWGAGGRTPAANNWGSNTPAAGAAQDNDPGWGSVSPNRNSSSTRDDSWSNDVSPQFDDRQSSVGWGASVSPGRQQSVNFGSTSPQPVGNPNWDSHDDYSAPTPYGGAPTPYGSAPTPYGGAPTPGAPTPGGGYNYNTPGYSAPTPAGGMAPTPYGAPTPGVGASTPYDSSSGPQIHPSRMQIRHGPPSDWYKDNVNIKVRIDSIGQFKRAKYDGKYGSLQGCNANDDVVVRVLDDSAERITISHQFVTPVQPGDGAFDRRQQAMVIEGDYKGELAQLLTNDEDEWMVKVFPSGEENFLSTYSMVQYVK